MRTRCRTRICRRRSRTRQRRGNVAGRTHTSMGPSRPDPDPGLGMTTGPARLRTRVGTRA